MFHSLFTVQSGAEVLYLVQLDGGDCMGHPGVFHLSHLKPLFPSPLVYLVSVITLFIISSCMYDVTLDPILLSYYPTILLYYYIILTSHV